MHIAEAMRKWSARTNARWNAAAVVSNDLSSWARISSNARVSFCVSMCLQSQTRSADPEAHFTLYTFKLLVPAEVVASNRHTRKADELCEKSRLAGEPGAVVKAIKRFRGRRVRSAL
eukprot:6015051-Pleurochrysis_carterae.AAC.1